MKKEIGMNLRAKNYLDNHKKAAAEKLSARSAQLKGQGLDEAAIRRDPSIRKIRAQIRKANFRLASIAAQEKLNAEKVADKERKLAEKKAAHGKPTTKQAKAEAGRPEAGRNEKKKRKDESKK